MPAVAPVDDAIENRVTKPSALGDDAAMLPLAIAGLQVLHLLDWYVRLPTKEDPVAVLLGKDHYSAMNLKPKHCFYTSIPKIRGLYEITLLHPLEIKGARLIHGITVDELEKCVVTVGEKRKKSKVKNPRIVELKLSTFTQLAGPWIL